MDRRVTLCGYAEEDEGGGSVTRTALDLAEVWAEVIPLSGRESWQSLRELGGQSYTVRFRRPMPDGTVPSRLMTLRLDDDKVLNIRNVSGTGRDAYYELLCSEQT
jgi:head-tail adaptor